MTIYMLRKTTVWKVGRVTKRLSRISEIVRDLCSEAQYSHKSAHMQSLIQQISRENRHDVIVESPLTEDQLAAGILYVRAVSRLGGTYSKASHPQRLLLIPESSLGPAQALLCEMAGNGGHRKTEPLLLGLDRDARTDLRSLKDQAAAVIITPRRLIDHLRRNNILLDRTRTIVMFQPDHVGNPQHVDSYASDAQFIFTKLSRKCRSVLFSGSEISPALLELLTRPKTISAHPGEVPQDLSYIVTEETSAAALYDYILVQGFSQTHIICTGEKDYNPLSAYFNQDRLSLEVTVSRAYNQKLTAENIIIIGAPGVAEVSQILTQSKPHSLTVLIRPDEQVQLSHIQEKFHMNKKKLAHDTEVLKNKIAALIDDVEKDSSPEQLNELRKLIKKAAPFYRRGYLTAYLLREYLQQDDGDRQRSRRPRNIVDPETSATLFFGVGKNRKTFPKDIARLLKEHAGLDSEQIHSIKTLDNYSFVAVDKQKAPTAIEKLDGMKYKGRPLVVNFAKSKAK